jgi:hypothetical protein
MPLRGRSQENHRHTKTTTAHLACPVILDSVLDSDYHRPAYIYAGLLQTTTHESSKRKSTSWNSLVTLRGTFQTRGAHACRNRAVTSWLLGSSLQQRPIKPSPQENKSPSHSKDINSYDRRKISTAKESLQAGTRLSLSAVHFKLEGHMPVGIVPSQVGSLEAHYSNDPLSPALRRTKALHTQKTSIHMTAGKFPRKHPSVQCGASQ